MTLIDPNQHMEDTWGLDANPFPPEAISSRDGEPWADLYPAEMTAFGRKFIRGGVRGGGAINFLWSQGATADTGFGKTRLTREMRDRVNTDLGATVLTKAGLRPERQVKVAAAYTNLNSLDASGLYPVLHAAAADLAIFHNNIPAVLDTARQLIIDRIAERDGLLAKDVERAAIADELRRVRLDDAPTGSALRPELIDGFAAGSLALRQAIGQVSDATKLRSGIAYLDFALTALSAAGIEKLFLFIDQLEDLANNRTLTKAKRDREVGRIRDLQETEPYASRLRMVLTFHATAASALADFWEKHRLPSFEAVPANDAAVVVLRGITSEEHAAELLKAYLDADRVESVDDELSPFQMDAVSELLAHSEGRVGILLANAHKVFDAAARAGLPAITADIVRETLGGGAAAAPAGVVVTGGADDDVDDLLLA
jgi:hypothetical protein